jgi:hypothetical protein
MLVRIEMSFEHTHPEPFSSEARWSVFKPGAAQASITWLPGLGFKKEVGRQLA